MRMRYLETTGKCNLNCPFCVERYRNYDMCDMDFYKTVDNNIELFKDKWLWLDFNGEPLVDKKIYERIRYLENKGALTQMSTNGYYLNEENILRLIEAGLRYIVVSVVSLDSDIYKKLRGRTDLNVVLENINKLKEIVAEYASPLQIQAVATDFAGNDLPGFISYFNGQNINVAIHKYTNRCGDVRLNKVETNMTGMRRGECTGLEDNLIVLSNCDVVCCCCDYSGKNVLGNLRDYDYSLKKLLENGKLNELIKGQKEGNYVGQCRWCDDWIYYQEKSDIMYVQEFPV